MSDKEQEYGEQMGELFGRGTAIALNFDPHERYREVAREVREGEIDAQIEDMDASMRNIDAEIAEWNTLHEWAWKNKRMCERIRDNLIDERAKLRRERI